MLFKKRYNIRRVNALVRGLWFSGLVFSLFSGLFGVYGVGSWLVRIGRQLAELVVVCSNPTEPAISCCESDPEELMRGYIRL